MKIAPNLTSPNVDAPTNKPVQGKKSFREVLHNDSFADHAKDFVNDVLNDQKKLNTTLKRAMRGGEMSQTKLLRTQALLYRYTQEVDLASKVVDKTANGVKQLMSIQV